MPTNYTLNIGLAAPTGGFLEAAVVLQALSANGFFAHRSEVFDSDTEPTLVVSGHSAGDIFKSKDWPRAAYRVAEALGQDCIAVYCDDLGAGTLAGPRAPKWGDFNPKLFITIDGTRLG